MALIGINGKIGAGKDTVARIIQYLCYTKKQNIELDNNFILSCLPDKNIDENLLAIRSSWTIKKFAGKLKEIVALLTGCRVEDLEDQEFKKQFLGQEWINTNSVIGDYDISKPPTYRQMLQWVGTEAMRNVIHENVWVNSLFADYKNRMSLQFGILDLGKEKSFEPIGEPTKYDYPKWIISDMRFPNEMQAIKERGGITICVRRPGTDVGSTHPSETALDQSPFHYIIDNNGTIEELIEKVREILIKENLL